MDSRTGPFLTVDVIIEHPRGIVLIERKFEPLGWALPGGFVEPGEHVAEAARREIREETGLETELLEQFFAYSNPARDKRKHTVSVVFAGWAAGEPRAGDDAMGVRFFKREELPANLCFDHGQILADYFVWRDTGRRPPAER
ncbi:MAG: hypothetical protein GMKNLPBB_02808 [Myxococcota bacterium]|nr:hypothetical protein [Myxococcota bacterium]